MEPNESGQYGRWPAKPTPQEVEQMNAQRDQEAWYAQPDDLVGGWCVVNVPKPPSHLDLTKGEWLVASFVRQEDAEAISAYRQALLGTTEREIE